MTFGAGRERWMLSNLLSPGYTVANKYLGTVHLLTKGGGGGLEFPKILKLFRPPYLARAKKNRRPRPKVRKFL